MSSGVGGNSHFPPERVRGLVFLPCVENRRRRLYEISAVFLGDVSRNPEVSEAFEKLKDSFFWGWENNYTTLFQSSPSH